MFGYAFKIPWKGKLTPEGINAVILLRAATAPMSAA